MKFEDYFPILKDENRIKYDKTDSLFVEAMEKLRSYCSSDNNDFSVTMSDLVTEYRKNGIIEYAEGLHIDYE